MHALILFRFLLLSFSRVHPNLFARNLFLPTYRSSFPSSSASFFFFFNVWRICALHDPSFNLALVFAAGPSFREDSRPCRVRTTCGIVYLRYPKPPYSILGYCMEYRTVLFTISKRRCTVLFDYDTRSYRTESSGTERGATWCHLPWINDTVRCCLTAGPRTRHRS